LVRAGFPSIRRSGTVHEEKGRGSKGDFLKKKRREGGSFFDPISKKSEEPRGGGKEGGSPHLFF